MEKIQANVAADEKRRTEEVEVQRPAVKVKDVTPNEKQAAFINSPVDANVRVLADPGTGKTFCIEHRNVFLLKNGVPADKILNVTFSKDMAASGKDRVLAALAQSELKIPTPQLREFEKWFCTIHASCKRILAEEGDTRQKPKDWQTNKILKEVAEKLFPAIEDRPGPQELIAVINMAKGLGLTTDNDMALFGSITDINGRNVGRELHEARRMFDADMRRENWFTFTDMVLDMEIKLRRDSGFRNKWQNKFQVVMVDEGQDTSAQAMRILITLSLEPGDNRIYDKFNPVSQFKGE